MDDLLLRSGVERQLQIIGNAMRSLASIDEYTAALLGQYQRIIAFRNVIVHQYMEVDDDLVWDVLHRDVPELEAKVAALLHGNV